jgi:hypothetical protein
MLSVSANELLQLALEDQIQWIIYISGNKDWLNEQFTLQNNKLACASN